MLNSEKKFSASTYIYISIYLTRMKDVGEDMLVDMSEILFNELAFFRLMQDLDG